VGGVAALPWWQSMDFSAQCCGDFDIAFRYWHYWLTVCDCKVQESCQEYCQFQSIAEEVLTVSITKKRGIDNINR